MRNVTIEMAIAGMAPDEVYERIGSFERYPDYTDAVRDVDVSEAERDRSRSNWEINFRDGVMRWKEEDRLFPEDRRIEFHAVGGDLASFDGRWQVEEGRDGSELTFAADFDLGLASLNEMVEPIADEALRESIERIVTGLTEGRAKVVEGAAPSSAGEAGED